MKRVIRPEQDLERKAEQKTLRRLRKRKPKMKVSGAGVRKLQRIILKKSGEM